MKWNSLFEQFLFKILGNKRTSHFTRTCNILKNSREPQHKSSCHLRSGGTVRKQQSNMWRKGSTDEESFCGDHQENHHFVFTI